jgi:glycine cleavage system H lipoate-binding protein
MKSFYSILLSALLLASPFSLEAGSVSKVDCSNRAKDVHKPDRTEWMSNLRSHVKTQPASNKAPQDAHKFYYTDIIHEVSGEVTNYTVSATSYFPYYTYILNYFYTGMVGHLVFEEADHTVYMENPISYTITNTWAKGTYTDTQLSFQFPQPIYADAETGEIYELHRMIKNEAKSTAYAPVFEVDDSKPLTYTKDSKGDYVLDSEDGTVMVGMTDSNGSWIEYGDVGVTLSEFEKKVLTPSDMPADFEHYMHVWVLVEADDLYEVKIGEYDGKVYFQGLYEDNPHALLVGELDGNKVIIPSGQYVGIDDDFNYYVFAHGIHMGEIYDSFFDKNTTAYYIEDDIKFDYDRSKGTLTCTNEAFAMVGGEVDDAAKIEVFGVYEGAVILREPDDVSLEPKPAYDLKLDVGWDESILNFTFDGENNEGWPLDRDALFYRIYFEGEVFTFSHYDYWSLEEPTDEIGFDQIVLDEAGYADVYYYRGTRYVYFYFEAENPGVQTIYREEDGTEHCSEIVYVDPASVGNITANRQVVSTTYTDLSGRQVVEPHNGLYIKTVNYSDGSRKTTKVTIQ